MAIAIKSYEDHFYPDRGPSEPEWGFSVQLNSLDFTQLLTVDVTLIAPFVSQFWLKVNDRFTEDIQNISITNAPSLFILGKMLKGRGRLFLEKGPKTSFWDLFYGDFWLKTWLS